MEQNVDKHYIYASGKDEFGIMNQIERCKSAIAETYGDAAKDKIKTYVDQGYSGKNINRPAFLNLCEDIEKGKVKKFYVSSIDRLTRDFESMISFKEFIEQHHANIISLQGDIDLKFYSNIKEIIEKNKDQFEELEVEK